ncbi:MAG TPA: inositol monophosphatase family protein [Gemmatimonadaceae bacterium]|nr:inositol monophosphatase family protein [Gemmatimonadaceae bacterium]
MTAAIKAHRELLATAVTAAVAASELIRGRAADISRLDWRVKSQADFVSDVDIAAEEAIRDIVLLRHPGAALLGEELSPAQASDAALAFVVDPLDGTTNFLHGYPWYAVSIAALADGVLAAGVVLNVPSGELFTATAGGGARRSGTPIAVSAIADPTRALVGTGFPFKHLDLLDRYQRQFAAVIRGTAGIRRAGAAALDLADVACGRFDAFWELHLAPWDVAAGILLVREAGGLATDLRGAEAPVGHGAVVAGNPAMHAWLLRTVGDHSDAGDGGTATDPTAAPR